MTKKFFTALAAIAMLAVPACDEIEKALNEEIPCTSIIFDEPTFMMTVGETKTLPVTVEPANTTDKLEWFSNDEETVSITDGVATAKKEGIASISVKAGNQQAGCRIVVQKAQGGTVAVESISVDPPVTNISIGGDGTLTAIVTPSNATGTIEWKSDNPQVVTVVGISDRQARINGVTPGTTKVMAIIDGKMAFSEVTVGGGGGGSTTLNSAAVDPSFVALGLNQEQVVSLVMDPADAEVTIYWESQASYIAKVQMISKTQAKITGVAVGQTVVTVHAGDLTANCQVSVSDSDNSVPVESVTHDKHELTLGVNQQYQFTATVLPENASNKEVVWISSANSSKLYISSTGQLSALQPCEATITVRCKANPMIYDTCQVTVTGGSGTDPGDEVVDLGLPSGLKWRGWNVGASKPEEYGDLLAWGETSPKASYTWSNYKYKSSDIYGDGVGKKGKTLIAEDDAATVNVGSGWRTPKISEWKELESNCTWTWTTRGGVNGALVTGPNGKSIFLPAAGYCGSGMSYRGSMGSYWSSSYGNDEWAQAFEFRNGDTTLALIDRAIGRSVRPVKD